MPRQRNHTTEVKFTLRIENRLNDYLAEWAKEEGKSKGLLIEAIIGSAVRLRQKEKEPIALPVLLDLGLKIEEGDKNAADESSDEREERPFGSQPTSEPPLSQGL